MNFRDKANAFFYFGTLSLIITISYLFYAPCNYFYYSSDHAIQVLMSKNFILPRDYFYWGQNRLGSLLPMLAFLLRKLVHIHYLYVCSIVHYLFLFTGFVFLSKQIKSPTLKVALCAVIFLPVNDYNALILIGHPYSAQLFAGSLFVFFLFVLKKYLLANKILRLKQMLISLLLSFGASIFFMIGIWVSEFNAILILIPVIFILFQKELRNTVIAGFRNGWFILLDVLAVSFFLFLYSLYYNIKKLFRSDTEYDKFFIDNKEDIIKNFNFFYKKLDTSLFFKDVLVFENSFNWFLIALTIVIIVHQLLKSKSGKAKSDIWINCLLVICIISSVLLLLSSWNLRSEFCPRYYTPVYIIFCYALLLSIDQDSYRKWIKVSVTICFFFFCTAYCYNVIIRKNPSSPFDMYGEYRNLPKGTLIGDYWDTYKISSIAADNLQSLPFDDQLVRNWDWREEALSENNFYFLKNERVVPDDLNDTIRQFGILFKYSGVKYICNQTEVLLYHKESK